MCAVRVAIVDRRPLVRHALRRLLAGRPGIEVVAAAHDGAADLVLCGPAPDAAAEWDVPLLRYTDADDVDALATLVLEHAAGAGPRPRSRDPLTRREREVLGGIAAGLRSDGVADRLSITPKSVENHKQRIFAKLGVQSQTHAVAVALDSGPLPAPERGAG